jgi:hypothetical protein
MTRRLERLDDMLDRSFRAFLATNAREHKVHRPPKEHLARTRQAKSALALEHEMPSLSLQDRLRCPSISRIYRAVGSFDRVINGNLSDREFLF